MKSIFSLLIQRSMIAHSGKLMRLSKPRMQFVSGTMKKEQTSASIAKSLNKKTKEQLESVQGPLQKLPSLNLNHYYEVPPPFLNQTHYYNQPQLQSYYAPQGQYNQTTYYNELMQHARFFSTDATVQRASTQLSPVNSTPIVLTNPTLDEKEKKKWERQELARIKAESSARFKSYLSGLPLLEYPDIYKVECVDDAETANQKILQLLDEDKDHKFGLDLEWPPCFVKGKPENKVSLVQICSSNRILLIQVSRMRVIPIELRRFFENRQLLKSGVNIGADGLKLFKDFGLVTNGLVELRDLAEISVSLKTKITHLRSLRALTGIFLDQNMEKGKVRISNWGKSTLTPLQVKYAALDAYASYQLFVVMEETRNKKYEVKIRHLADESLGKEEKPKSLSQRTHKLDNQSTPTSTVTVVKKKYVQAKSSRKSSSK